MENSSQSMRKKCGIFQMDLQDKTYSRWKLHQIDMKKNLPNGVIEEEVYIEQPQGFEVKEKITCVCKSKKAMYGPK